MQDIIDKALVYAKDFFENEFSGHDFYHTLRVYNLAKHIANNEKCNVELVCIAALLHDVDDYKIVRKEAEPFYNAKNFLRGEKYPESNIEKICHIISEAPFKGKDTVVPDTIEGKILQDADLLDAIGAIGVARVFTYGGNHNRPIHIPNLNHKENMSGEEYQSTVGSTTINHFYEKLLKLKDLMNTKTAKDLANHRHEYMETFLKEFYDEWEGII